MRSSHSPRKLRQSVRAFLLALAALFVVDGLDAPSAVASNDPCTITLSNPGTSDGGPGRDVMCGTGGTDRLLGHSGNDELRGFGGNDELFGNGGDDTLSGSSGNDELNGGDGNDVIVGGTGFDSALAAAGNDTILFRDGQLDALSLLNIPCGSGTDSLDLDLLDATVAFPTPIPGLLQLLLIADCEHITVGAIDEGPNVVISGRSRRVGRDGRTTVRLRCPRSLPARCKGRLKLQLGTRRSLRRTAPKAHYSIRPGKTRGVEVRLSRRDRHSLRRHGSADGVVTSVEAGQHGDKTTVQTVKLKPRR